MEDGDTLIEVETRQNEIITAIDYFSSHGLIKRIHPVQEISIPNEDKNIEISDSLVLIEDNI